MVLWWAMPNPPSGIHARMPITSPEALARLRIRTYDESGANALIAAGAAPIQIAWSDLVPQLSTGGIDAVLTVADGGKQLSIRDNVSDFNELNYAMALFAAHVNKDEFNKPPEQAKQALMDKMAIFDALNRELMGNYIQQLTHHVATVPVSRVTEVARANASRRAEAPIPAAMMVRAAFRFA